jgi:C-terminal processing protease CtpA/Prc
VVGLTLRPELDGRYTVIGVPEYEGKPAVPEVKAGDVLVMIDRVPAKDSTMGQVWSLLGGDPGETRVLTLERNGKQFTVNATVRRFLPAE